MPDNGVFYKEIIDGMNDTVWIINFEGELIDVNNTALARLGYTREELLQIGLGGIDCSLNKEMIKSLAARMPGDKLQVFETVHRAKDGKEFQVEVSSSIINFRGEKVILSIARDISDRKRIENALRESEQLYRNLIERTPDGVYKSTHEGRFVEVNPSMVRMLGYATKEELMAVDIKKDLYFEPSERDSLTLRERLEELGIFRMRRKDGSEIWVEDHGWYVTNDRGDIVFHEGIIRDVTERKESEYKLLIQAEELQALVVTKDKFFSIIAHDLIGPFNAILGFSDLLLENYKDLDGESLGRSLQAINSASRQAYALLENLLLWSRAQTGRVELKPEVIHLSEKVHEILRLVKIQANNKDMELSMLIPGHVRVLADRNMLGTILRNLLSNAIKFTPHHGKVEVGASIQDRFIEISVTDTGVGIPHENLDKIFRVENKLSTPGTDKEKGSGLGLVLCREFVTMQGGSIWVESKQGKGSTFRFTLPVAND